MKLLLCILFTLSGCTSHRGRYQDDIPADKLDCNQKYIHCIQAKKPKDDCDKAFDECDLGNYKIDPEIDND